MKDSSAVAIARRSRGFSLLELIAVVAIIFALAALAVPNLMTQIYAVRLRYSATDLSGLLQRARMEAVRKNSFYSVQYVAGSPAEEQVVDKSQTAVATIPPTMLGNGVSVFFGSGSGAPGESNFLTTLNFTPAASTAGFPSFNARGLPCIPVGGVTCPMTVGQGFVFFLSGASNSSGTSAWAAVAVTPGGRCELFTYGSGTWTQQ